MGRSSNDYFSGLQCDSGLKTKIWSYLRELERAETKIKELNFLNRFLEDKVEAIEKEIKRLKDDIT